MNHLEHEKAWLMHFNPCGLEMVPGYVLRNCQPLCKVGTLCLNQIAYQMTGFLLEGANPEAEEIEIQRMMNFHKGSPVSTVSGANQLIDSSNIPVNAREVRQRAIDIVTGIRACMQNTRQDTKAYYDSAEPKLRASLEQVGKINSRINRFNGTLDEALVLAREMQAGLSRVIDLGGQDLGVIARQALAYGLLGDDPAIDPTGLIFIGDLNKLQSK